MAQRHATRILELASGNFGAICTCGWRYGPSSRRASEIEANEHTFKAVGLQAAGEDPAQIPIPGTRGGKDKG